MRLRCHDPKKELYRQPLHFYTNDFDDSHWNTGKGIWKHSGITLDKYASTWSKEEFLLMRSTFEIDVLDKKQAEYLKLRKNIITVYATDRSSPNSPNHYAALDAWIEGITKTDQVKLNLALEEILSPQDREALESASNGGYHYFGSAKIFAQLGKAFAEAILQLIKK